MFAAFHDYGALCWINDVPFHLSLRTVPAVGGYEYDFKVAVVKLISHYKLAAEKVLILLVKGKHILARDPVVVVVEYEINAALA